MAAQQQTRGQTTDFTASQRELGKTRTSNTGLLNLGVFDDETALLQEEFCRLLDKSGFVEEIIDFYIYKERQLLTGNGSVTDWPHYREYGTTGEWKELVRTRLPDWLFWLTYILTAQAKLVEENRQISRGKLADLIKSRLFLRNRDDRLCGARKKRFWTPALLRHVVNEALKDINTPGRVNLENLATNINFRTSKPSSPIKLFKPLSAKHLQKLLRQNDINWIKIKRRYVERLILERKARR
jgi:hypothetical protein